MKKEMLINVLQPEECRIAIIEDGVLEELYVERTSHESYTGNIYKGRIVNLEPAIQAAFVDFSVGRNGFLHVSDVEPQYFERIEGAHDEIGSGARERDRERKRDPRRGRGRDDRRGSPPRPEPLGPPAAGAAAGPAPARRTASRAGPGTRSRQGPRPRARAPRPVDQRSARSIRADPAPVRRRPGRAARSQVRTGPAGRTSAARNPNCRLRKPPARALPETPTPRSLQRGPKPPSAPGTRTSPGRGNRKPEFGQAPEPVVEREPARDRPEEPFGRGFRPVEPIDPDLPPSRTQRPQGPAGPARPGEIEGQERGRHRVPPSLPSPD